jgi:hypothetical protein
MLWNPEGYAKNSDARLHFELERFLSTVVWW